MTTSDQEDQAERRETLDNDLKVLRQQSSTFHQHAQAQADEISQGRYRATGVPRVVGSTPTPASQYPAASAAHQTELPPEEPLGYRVDAMPELETSTGVPPVSPPVATDDPADAPSSDGGPATSSGGLVSERAGSSPLSQKDDDNG
jgi:hypothetical protein